MKLDILAFAAHPDDVELACGGSLILQILNGKKVGIIDLTKGEMGTRGSAELRKKESDKASKILGLSIRENLDLGDCFFEINEKNLLAVAKTIRQYMPDIILLNAPTDRHPDHGRGSSLVLRAIFISGLAKVDIDGLQAWRPKNTYHYIQDNYLKPDMVFDVTQVWEQRMKAVMAYSSQFFNNQSNEESTPISGQDFLKFLEARAREIGRSAGVEMGEGFIKTKPFLVEDF